jgi:hypothetical protein
MCSSILPLHFSPAKKLRGINRVIHFASIQRFRLYDEHWNLQSAANPGDGGPEENFFQLRWEVFAIGRGYY